MTINPLVTANLPLLSHQSGRLQINVVPDLRLCTTSLFVISIIVYCPNNVFCTAPPEVGDGVASAPKNDVRWFLAPGLEPCGDRTGGDASGCLGAGMDWASGFRKDIRQPFFLVRRDRSRIQLLGLGDVHRRRGSSWRVVRRRYRRRHLGHQGLDRDCLPSSLL